MKLSFGRIGLISHYVPSVVYTQTIISHCVFPEAYAQAPLTVALLHYKSVNMFQILTRNRL